MAFKFKTKKRPNALQSALAGFAGGFGTGFNKGSEAALTQMLKEREKAKENVTKELNSFNGLISGLPQTPSNRRDILNARLSIMKGGVTASEAVDALNIEGLDFQTDAEELKEIRDKIAFNETLRDAQDEEEKRVSESFDAKLAILEAQAKAQVGMTGRIPTPLEVEERTHKARLKHGLEKPPKPPKVDKPSRLTANQQLTHLTNIIEGAENELRRKRSSMTPEKIASAEAFIEKYKKEYNRILDASLGQEIDNTKEVIDY